MPSAATATEGCRCLSGHKAWGTQISDALLSTGPTGLYLGHSESHHELALASGWHSPAEEALSSQQALRAAVVGVHRPLLATQGTLATGRTQRPACYLQTTDATGPPSWSPSPGTSLSILSFGNIMIFPYLQHSPEKWSS
jgi:hypothetical protein